jgi:plastocyanin
VIEEYTLTTLPHGKRLRGTAAVAFVMICIGCAWGKFVPALARATEATSKRNGPFFLPSGDAAKIVNVTKTGESQAGITVLSEAIAVKETGPKQTVHRFGEVYAFSPAFIAVHRDQPTQIEFWNLQPDDEHDFALVGPDLKVLMYVKLAPLQKTSYIFTFHKEGVIDFKCLRHQPAMSGQILVLPPQSEDRDLP